MNVVLALIIGIAALVSSPVLAAYVWKMYHYKMSRRDRYRTSDYDYWKHKIIKTICAFLAPLILGTYIIVQLLS